jgi:hypothetical protein
LAILARSFRLVTARLIPRRFGCKQALLLVPLILSGCGGSGGHKQQWRVVELPPYRFEVPAGWHATVGRDRYVARRGEDFVQAQGFVLLKRYRPALFAKVETELAARMAEVAKQTGGSVEGSRTVTPGGIKAHAYDVKVGKRTDTYTFVLRGKRELQLICSADASVCEHLISSFAVA